MHLNMIGRLHFLFLPLITEGLVLPYDAIYPAKVLYGMWKKWYEDPWMGGRNGEHLRSREPCDVPEQVTLQWAYFKTLIDDDSVRSEREKYFSIISQLATHLEFYKLKLYPFLPNTAHSRFCDYNKYGVKLVCHPERRRCMDCVKIADTTNNEVMREACNPETPTTSELPGVPEGVDYYKSLKRWMRKMGESYVTRKAIGDLCTATDRQTLGMIRIQKLLRSFYLLTIGALEARTQDEWETEWNLIEDKFGSDYKLSVMREHLLDFDEADSNGQYCDSSEGLLCDGYDCVSCEKHIHGGNEVYRWFNSSYLKSACEEMGARWI